MTKEKNVSPLDPTPRPELELYKQGEQHFKAHNVKEAIYQVASATAILLNVKDNLGNSEHCEPLKKVLLQAKQPLEIIIGKETKIVCSADVILPLARLINNQDERVRKALSKITTFMEIK